ncbi:hypothetical protein AVEN_97134-1 [Araneus ventricosus]|uniref:Uncharacterized protein n=1 Tax=Araneus ventricosus TaxID=182803 RepID=A0A4Y2W6C7_ARAVE|nr:hypothetical protein AVEN_97134-1 [Araneus ventricosus]
MCPQMALWLKEGDDMADLHKWEVMVAIADSNFSLQRSCNNLALQICSKFETRYCKRSTCFASGLVDYALILCRKFAAKLPYQICHDKLISRKITLAASVRAIWDPLFLLLTSIIQKWKTVDMRLSNELLDVIGQVVGGFHKRTKNADQFLLKVLQEHYADVLELRQISTSKAA